MRPFRKPAYWAGAVVALLFGALILGITGPTFAQTEGSRVVMILEVRGVIDPIVAQYVKHGLDTARNTDTELVIILLDTPGGLDTAMRDIVQAILNADLPTVVYVEPSGARAASAGVFITMAAHGAAMAPGTNIGAAHPLALGDQGEIIATLEDKITNDAVAYLRAIAQQRGRNADWAEAAVRYSASLTAQQALEKQVIDLMATDLADLLRQLDGRRLSLKTGEIRLSLKAAVLKEQPMTWLEMIAHGLVDPNIAYILLSLGTIALIAEFYNPGTILPSVTGIICLTLAFIALGNLPVNWGGILLIGLAFLLFILDLKVTGFALTVAGAISFIFGSLFLFSPFVPESPVMPRLTVSPWLLVLMTVLLVGFFSFALTAGLRAQRQKVLMGNQTLVGAVGLALSNLAPQGVVQVENETWTALAEEPVKAGEKVKVIGSEGLYLQVRRWS